MKHTHAPSTRPLRCVLGAVLLTTAAGLAHGADSDEIAELKRAVEALRAENRALAERLASLEAQRTERPPDSARPAASAPAEAPPALKLEQRVKELESSRTAQEDAVRSIIRDSVTTLGSKINDAVSLSGTLGVALARSQDFGGEPKTALNLNTAEFEFEIKANDWTTGQMKLEYIDGHDQSFTTSSGRQASVDRLNLDTAFITLGDVQRFPATLTAGRMVLPFGSSTGHPLADVLSISTPLTVEAFEMRGTALALGWAFPTPAPGPAAPPVSAPPVRPQWLQPWGAALGQRLGYQPPPTRPAPPAPTSFAPAAPPFSAGVYLYEGHTAGGLSRHLGGTLGYRAKGHCGRRYEDLKAGDLCPWSIDLDLGYNSSIFNSRFLETAYEPFLDQIGRVSAVSVSARTTLGPLALVGEWNSATRRARFIDAAGTAVAIRPSAWQLALAYQLDWNPWVEEIGAQGSYVAIGYSHSRDLAGVIRDDGTPTRVGFVPARRLSLTAGEWVLDGLRLVLEYSRHWDYPLIEGGTGRTSNDWTASLTYTW